jgi:DNA-binding CsgD family transcriptional regulator
MKMVPSSVSTTADEVLAARGQASQLRRVMDQNSVPMVIVDDQRRFLEVNWPALLTFRLTLAEMRKLRVDDLTAPDSLSTMDSAWTQMMESGTSTGPYRVATPDGGQFDLSHWGLANALPGRHLLVFALAPFREDLLSGAPGPARQSRLTPRELELLQLAADGLSGPTIAEKLVLSRATVRTHFANMYDKLDVRDRAGAVAKGMRLGLIE